MPSLAIKSCSFFRMWVILISGDFAFCRGAKPLSLIADRLCPVLRFSPAMGNITPLEFLRPGVSLMWTGVIIGEISYSVGLWLSAGFFLVPVITSLESFRQSLFYLCC